ncbi:MAG: IPT/TIG domain-containing protein, partial [Cyanobacteria bacterium NC_groundwater_1444_Ag_S-0.65um_54_12]|nr:IPT/TIG domain-containing protein [Cyanobacteria bacterium NC_groundwater_1444_Ag_S-0.65um_54_12]
MHRLVSWYFVLLLLMSIVGCEFTGASESLENPLAARKSAIKQQILPLSVASAAVTTPVNPRVSETAQQVSGSVVGLDGLPAAQVLVRGYLISNNSAALISNNSAALISNNSAAYHVASSHLATASSTLEVRTDEQGHFVLLPPSGAVLNIEAVLSDEIKALQQAVNSTTTGALQLQLAYTGNIRGKVQAGAAVKQLLGVDVFIPGTGYLAKTDELGSYEIRGVPPGRFTLVALHSDLGKASLSDVVVVSKQTTNAGDLVLAAKVPTIASVSSTIAAPGQTVEITGENFGISEGKRPTVLLNGQEMLLTETSDTVLKATVPNNAASGPLYVKLNGISSTTVAFSVLKFIEIYPDYWEPVATKDFEPLEPYYPPTDDDLAAGQQRHYYVRGITDDRQLIGRVAGVVWSSKNEDGAGRVDQSGIFTAETSGTVLLTATAGALKATDILGEPVESRVNISEPIVS